MFVGHAQQHHFLWGNVWLQSKSNGTTLRFVLQNTEADTTAKTSYTCYFAVVPEAKIQLQVHHHTAHVLSGKNSKYQLSLNQVQQQVPNSENALVTLKGYRWFRGKRLAEISVAPLLRNGQAIQAVDTIEASVSGLSLAASTASSNDKQFQSILNAIEVNSASSAVSMAPLAWSDSTKLWLPANGKAIKITVPNDGVYRLTYAQLTGVAPELAGVNPSMFQLYNKGHELPMTVKTASANIFSVGDYLEFVGTKNYNPDTLYRIIPTGENEYTEYLNRYTDTSYYWLVWGSAVGARYTTNDTTITSNDSLLWYTENVHLENNTVYAYCGDDAIEQQNPYWTPGDIWAWTYIYAGGQFASTFSATQIQSGAFSPRILMKVAGSAADGSMPAHLLQAGINSTFLADTTTLGPFEQSVIRRTINPSSLTEGPNTLHLYSYTSASATNSIVFDWADVEYPRSLTAMNDTLWFGFRDLSGTTVRRVVLHGFTFGSVVIYKTGNYPKCISGTVSGSGTYTVSFVDTVRNGDRYVVVSTEKIVTPSITYKSSFANLRNTSHRADYLLITDSAFYSIAEPYIAFIQSSYGLTTALVSIKDIFDEFGYGYPVPEAEREFLKATTNWTSPMPAYVLFVGKANYDYKNYLGIVSGSYVHNTVPAYGMPVTDPWTAVLDDSLLIPQMYVGRVPALSTDEFQSYFTRLKSYVLQPCTDWNKRYMFFAGGGSSSEFELFHSVNANVINNQVIPPPVGGLAFDFYKSTNNTSGFGTYSPAQAENIIDSSAVMITYVGHSGTEIWDNGIDNVTELQNTVSRYPLISDFGCSTAKFAEPNIRSFSEQFTVGTSGSTIGYIGNSSLGFVSIATTLPEYFFEAVMGDSTHTVGKDHLKGKTQTLINNGWNNSTMGRQLMLTNTLIGDPAVRLPIPNLPNLAITSDNIVSSPAFPSDDNDSLSLAIPYNNLGYVPVDTFTVKIQHSYLTMIMDTSITKHVPLYADTLHISYPIRNNPGTHTFTITLNPSHVLNEMSYTDNVCIYSVVVQSSAFRVVYPVPGLNCPPKKFTLLNPVKQTSDTSNVSLQIDTNSALSNPMVYTASRGSVITTFTPTTKIVEKYYWRAYSEKSDSVSGFYIPSLDSLTRWTQSLPSEWALNSYIHSRHDVTGIHLADSTYLIKLISSGWNTVRYGTVMVNGSNVINDTYTRGLRVVQLDTLDFHVIQQNSFDTFTAGNSDLLVTYLNTFPTRALVAMLAVDEVSNALTTSARNVIKEFGSKYIDNVGWRDPWALLGRKGDPVGTVLEGWYIASDSLRVQLDTTIVSPALTGNVISPSFGPASQWTKAAITKTIPVGSALGMYILGTTPTGSVDTLVTNDTSSTIVLTSFSTKKYRALQLLGKFTANASGETPILKNWDVLLKPPPELAINYQCVSTTADTLLEGKSLGITAKIYNAGEQPADSVKVVFTLMNNGIRQMDTLILPVVPADSFATLNYSLATTGRAGSNTEIISIDPEQSIPEIYTVNNYYSFSFYVQTDTTTPTMNVTFDGRRILNNDYVLARPVIRIAMYDNSPLPVTNPSNISLALDARSVTLSTATPDSLFTSLGMGTEKAVVEYHPSLSSGTHVLSVRVKDATGNYSDSLATEITFRVETEAKLLNVYNYPNPFASETYFTFDVAGESLPDEVHIKIYTIAGRLIQDIRVPQSDLSGGFNKILWNGKDRDGDSIANGIYFYKVVSKVDGKNVEVIQKLAKVR